MWIFIPVGSEPFTEEGRAEHVFFSGIAGEKNAAEESVAGPSREDGGAMKGRKRENSGGKTRAVNCNREPEEVQVEGKRQNQQKKKTERRSAKILQKHRHERRRRGKGQRESNLSKAGEGEKQEKA